MTTLFLQNQLCSKCSSVFQIIAGSPTSKLQPHHLNLLHLIPVHIAQTITADRESKASCRGGRTCGGGSSSSSSSKRRRSTCHETLAAKTYQRIPSDRKSKASGRRIFGRQHFSIAQLTGGHGGCNTSLQCHA